ncbi:MscS Mechanosensitive ion channel [Desulfovibrio sp. X2]|uniref:mechanosensitive ion channel family protein n=1 Tax=Desulfovibrio sp. X2 TaxID=941449 RepID=UPI000358CA65|nr:mechanosensitive ion channel domain-containing protein [Desulfovibrio sp. X2]EPR41741.1 MscS Mechanosensitive ion channel [Desulfovibrio sp. X2]
MSAASNLFAALPSPAEAESWAASNMLGPGAVKQYAALAVIVVLSWLLAAVLRKAVGRWLGRFLPHDGEDGLYGRLARAFLRSLPELLGVLLCAVGEVFFREHKLPFPLLDTALILAAAVAATRFAAALLSDVFLRRSLMVLIWFTALLSIAGVRKEALDVLDSVALTFGDIRLSLLTLLKALVLLGVLLKIGTWATDAVDSRLQQSHSLTPSARVLFSKLFRITALVVAVVIPLDSLGVKLTALTVFSGAVGVGVGFGLQKVIANFVSGLIILTDKSVRPGDVIEVGGVYGWVTDLRARFATVLTRDGTHFLIPNEELITNRVVNWSYGKPDVRLKIPVGVSYESDIRQAMRLMEQAGAQTGRVLSVPPPAARLMGFGDSSVNLELRFWISDPQGGVANVKSDVMLRIWDLFREHSITIPFPQRVVTLKTEDGQARADAAAKAANDAKKPS